MKPIQITRRTYRAIMRTIGRIPPEAGGILACDGDGVVCAFYFDANADTTGLCYRPSIADLEQVICEDWIPRGLFFCGICHSHPADPLPSGPDLRTAQTLMEVNGLTQLLLPIVTDGKLTVHVLCRRGTDLSLWTAPYQIIETRSNALWDTFIESFLSRRKSIR